jgi:hypothetical protein
MLYSSKKSVFEVFDADMMINQWNNICKAFNDEIVIEHLIRMIFFTTKAVFLLFDVDSNNSFFVKISSVKFASFSFEINRFFRYWLKISNDILFLFFFRAFFLTFWLSLDEWNDAQQFFNFFDVKTIESKINRKMF